MLLSCYQWGIFFYFRLYFGQADTQMLVQAAAQGDRAVLEVLVALGADLNARDGCLVCIYIYVCVCVCLFVCV